MAITIFCSARAGRQVRLQVNDDGSVTYHEENSGRLAVQRGIRPQDRVMTADEARRDFASYAEDINKACTTLAKGHQQPDQDPRTRNP